MSKIGLLGAHSHVPLMKVVCKLDECTEKWGWQFWRYPDSIYWGHRAKNVHIRSNQPGTCHLEIQVVDGSFHYAPEAMTLFDYRGGLSHHDVTVGRAVPVLSQLSRNGPP